MSTVSTGNIEHILDLTSFMSAENVFKKVEFTFGRFRDAPPSLDEEVFIVGSMSVIGAGGFERCLSGVFEFSHNVYSSIKSGFGFKERLSLKAKSSLSVGHCVIWAFCKKEISPALSFCMGALMAGFLVSLRVRLGGR